MGGVNDQIFIRGVGSFAESPLSSPGVAFNVDGVYVGRPDGVGSNFYDVARVEVLKGPQGTLYGRNANGGSINVITHDPVLGQDSAGLSQEVGNYGLTRTQGFGNLAIGETSALRAAFDIAHRQGYLSDHTDDDVHQSGRIRYKLAPSEDLTVHVNVDYTHLGGRGGGAVWLPLRPGADPWESTTGAGRQRLSAFHPAFGSVGGFAAAEFVPELALLERQRPAGLERRDRHAHGAAVLSEVRIEALTYQGLRYTQLESTKQKSVEARLGNTTERITWVVGGYYFDESPTGRPASIKATCCKTI